jgi:gamma-glutamyl:cysteine ligase YbdK (ATP-grasp superfamily)
MSASELAARVKEALAADGEAFASRVEEEVEVLREEIEAGTFDNPQAIVGLEYEFYAVDAETDALMRVPRRLLEYIGFEKELGLHNAELSTAPQPLSRYGLRAQEAEVQAKLDAAGDEVAREGMALVSDGMWTVPPVGETATGYLTDSVEEEGVRIATNMSAAVRYHAMANTDYAAELQLDAPHVSLSADTVMPESLITSIQPHYQTAHAHDLPENFRYALRVAGPLLALSVNSPFFPPDLYDADPGTVLADCWMENRVPVFESVLNPTDGEKVTFPRDLEDVDDALGRIAADETVVPAAVETGARFDDRFAHFRHKHGSFWRWVRPVFEGRTRQSANARIEFRPLPAQPTVRDTVALQAVFAGLLESLPRREHPVYDQSWEVARENFYAAVRDGLDADLRWVTVDATETTDTDELYAELFEFARDGLELRGLDAAEANRYIQPLRERVDRGVTPASWKHDRVRRAVDRGEPFAQAVWGMQSAYIDRQSGTLVEGTFVDWLDGGG